MPRSSDRILITGGAGLTGSHVTDLLVREVNPEIVILDNFLTGRRENLRWSVAHGRVEIIDGDTRDATLVHRLMRGVNFVFHHAGIGMVECVEDPRLAVEIVTTGTFNVLEAAALNNVRRVIAAGCASVYGLNEPNNAERRMTLHSTLTTFGECLLRSFHDMYGLRYAGLRVFNVYGARMDPKRTHLSFLFRWIERICRNQSVVIPGDGTSALDLVHVEDVARACVMAADTEVHSTVIDVGSGVMTDLNELARLLCVAVGTSVPAEYGPERKLSVVADRVAETDAAELLIGFRARKPLNEGLFQMISSWEQRRSLARLSSI